jgi:peptidoglycan biosynthesis protein MviN/MurJ (putative lipid II flippase)
MDEMKRAQAGLRLMFWAFLVSFLVELAVSSWFLRVGDDLAALRWMHRVVVIASLVYLGARALVLVGLVRLFREPRLRTPARVAFASVAIDGLLVVLQLCFPDLDALDDFALGLGLAAWVAMVSSFLLLLRRVGVALERPLPAWITPSLLLATGVIVGLTIYCRFLDVDPSAMGPEIQLLVAVPFLLALAHGTRPGARELPTARVFSSGRSRF